MYLSGSISILQGLRLTTEKVAERFDEGPFLFYQGSSLSESLINDSVLSRLQNNSTYCRLLSADLFLGDGESISTYLLSIENPLPNIKIDLSGLSEKEAWIGKNLFSRIQAFNISLSHGSNLSFVFQGRIINLTYEETYPSTLLPDDWVLVAKETLFSMNPIMERNYSFLLVRENSQDFETLSTLGLKSVPTASAIKFIEKGIYQAEGDLWGIVLSSGFIIAILIFSVMSLELRYKREEIKILKQLGASPTFLLALFLSQASYLSLFGSSLGIAMAIVAIHALASISSLFGYATFISPLTSIESVLLPLSFSLLFTLLGAFVPSLLSAKARTKEGFPF